MSTDAVLATARAVRAVEVTKTYGTGPAAVTALDRVSLEVPERSLTVLMGPPGAGTSTLLHCLAGLEDVSSGEVFLGDLGLHTASEGLLAAVRHEAVGVVFDGFNLLPALTVGENILTSFGRVGARPDPQWVAAVVTTMGLAGRLEEWPAELTGGEQQQVALARALITRPQVIFADDLTARLDHSCGAEVLATLRSAVDDLGQTVVLATGDPRALAYADEVVLLAEGRVTGRITPGASAPRA